MGAAGDEVTLTRGELPSEDDGWCPGRFFTHGNLMRSTYTAPDVSDDGNKARYAVLGDPVTPNRSHSTPSSAVLAFGSDVEGDPIDHCGEVFAVKAGGREIYVVVAGYYRGTAGDSILAEESHLYLSPRITSTLCCEEGACLGISSDGESPEPTTCSEAVEFEARFIDGRNGLHVPTDEIIGTSSLPGVSAVQCEDQSPEKKALAVEMNLMFGGRDADLYPPFAGGQASLEKECGETYEIFNADEAVDATLVVTITEYTDLDDATQGDGTFGLRIEIDDCETLCPGGCEAGRMGSPPPSCHLKFKEWSGEVDPTDDEASSTAPDGWTGILLRPWNDVAEKCDFSCGAVQQPEDCGTSADKPCFASMKAKECGDVLQVQNGDGDIVFVQVVDDGEADLSISSEAWPTVCKMSCNGFCADTCEDDAAPDYCHCAECVGGGSDHEECSEDGACDDCSGQCIRVKGSTKASPLQGFYQFLNNSDIPSASFGRQAVPLCALAAAGLA